MENTVKKYSFFQGPIKAFYSKDFYSDVAANWRGTGALYLLLLLLVSWTVSCICFAVWLHAAFESNNALVAQIPKVSITSSKITIDRPTPYLIRNPKSNEGYVLFTDKEENSLQETDPPAVVTPTKVLVYSEQGQRIFTASDLYTFFKSVSKGRADAPFEFDQATVKNLLELMSIAEPIVVFLALPLIFAAHLIHALLYSLVALITANTKQIQLPYQTLLRLSAVALTPAVVISTILWLPIGFNYTLPTLVWRIWQFASVAVSVFYVVFAVKAVSAAPISESVHSNS